MKVTKGQISAVKYLIFQSPDGVDLAKKLMAKMIDRSRGFRLPVKVHLVPGRFWKEDELKAVADSFHDMSSSNCDTHLGAIIHTLGTELRFHYYVNGTGSGRRTYIFCLSVISRRGHDIKRVSISRRDVNSVSLQKSGLYNDRGAIDTSVKLSRLPMDKMLKKYKS